MFTTILLIQYYFMTLATDVRYFCIKCLVYAQGLGCFKPLTALTLEAKKRFSMALAVALPSLHAATGRGREPGECCYGQGGQRQVSRRCIQAAWRLGLGTATSHEHSLRVGVTTTLSFICKSSMHCSGSYSYLTSVTAAQLRVSNMYAIQSNEYIILQQQSGNCWLEI